MAREMIIRKAERTSPDMQAELVAKLKPIIPEAFAEGKIDWERLKRALGGQIDSSGEKFTFTWAGKSNAVKNVLVPGKTTLRPDKKASVKFDETENIFIEGDNLEVLKLLQKAYFEKVKMIYIDPPYNTGNDFVYRDDFKAPLKNYLEQFGQMDSEGNRPSTNTQASGRFHSDWLTMMYPRLKMAWNLLRHDGVIFVSIDDNEVHHLRMIMDEIFGEENFVANFIWKKKGTSTNVKNTQVSSVGDYLLCYRKTDQGKLIPKVTLKLKETRNYPYKDDLGKYRTTIIEKKDAGSYARKTMKFEIIGQKPRAGKRWQIGEKEAERLEKEGRFFIEDRIVKLKIYDFEDEDTTSAWSNFLEDCGSSDSAAKMLNEQIFDTPELFNNPKPIELIQKVITLSTNINSDELVLDFFAGSGTTAHAVLAQNQEDGGNRKFILVQMPEPTDPKSEAHKAGFKTIADIQKTNPVLILDEPQNMEGEATQEKLKNFNALFRLRFSATHKNLYNLMYQLAPYNAYQMGLVKKIEVYSVADEDESESAAAFVNLLAVTSSRAKLKAKVEVLIKDRQGNIGKKIVSLNQNDDLAKKTNNAVYAGYIVDEMNADAPDFGSVGSVRFKNGVEIKRDTEPGRDRKDLMREQIKVTIEQHLKKRRELKKKGIKPLSLFFIDRVDNYIREDGFISKTFDELFNALKSGDKELEKFQPAEVRKGYFAERNGDYLEREKAIAENKEAYDLIMKDKERLLSFDEKTEFIFTHSALKEGWDNPNVFNICTLNATVSTMKKRQEIGRGMRLCVNQDGERVFDRNINLLSVIANENYSDYITRLQTEFIEEGIHKAPPMPANARAKKIIKLRKGFEKDPNFTAIWNKISKKTRYFVAVDAARLTRESVKAINELAIERRQINVTRVAVDIGRETIGSRIIGSGTEEKSSERVLIDCVNFIKDETNLTRRTVVDILCAVNPKSLFNNPDRFMFEAAKIIKAVLVRNYIEQITYELDGDKFNLAQFEQMVGHKTSVQEISNRHKSIYDAVVFSSDVEKNFAVELDKDERIKLFIKLPGWFTVNTPLGGYVPDWAIVTAKIDVAGKESKEKVYFVIETKGTTDEAGRRVFENQKIECAMRHFEVVDVKYKDVADYSDFAREL